MTDQDNDDLFSDPRPIAECQDDRALCFVPEPDEELEIDGFWEVLQKTEDGEWINDRCIQRQPSHFVPADVLAAKYVGAEPKSIHQTYPLTEVPAQLQAMEFFDLGSAEYAFHKGRVRPGQLLSVDGVLMEFDASGNLVRFN
jgi:hypothetical protein